MVTTEVRATENNTKPMNTRVRRGGLFRFQRKNGKFFFVKDSKIFALNLIVFYNCNINPSVILQFLF